jgi:hypothetical protein
MSYKSIGQVANYKPLTALGMEELAARQRLIQPSGGVLFARNADGEEKMKARQLVIDLFTLDKWDRPLHMITMPGLLWRFERKLLGLRERGWMQLWYPRQTYFNGVENDRSIYFAAVPEMPGLHTPRSTLKRTRPYPFSEMGVKTRYASYFFADVDDMMSYNWEVHSLLNGKPDYVPEEKYQDGWHAAWFDFTGPISLTRLAIIKHFYEKYIDEILIVTALNARWDRETSRAITKAGGHGELLRKYLTGEVLHDIKYTDTSPMAQFAVRKR